MQAQQAWVAQGTWLKLITLCGNPHVLAAAYTFLPCWLLPSALTSDGINSCLGLHI